MNWMRLMLLFAAIPCMACGSVNVQAVDASKTAAFDSVPVLDNLGVCGPIHEAVIRFGPKDEEGRLDTAPLDHAPTSFGSWTITMDPPQDLGISFAGHRPHQLKLHEYKGTLQSVLVIWNGTPRERSTVRKKVLKHLGRSKGEPEPLDKNTREWRDEETRTVLYSSKADQVVVVFVSCLADEEQLRAVMNEADAPEENATETSTVESETQVHDPFLGRSIMDILRDFGQPSHVHPLSERLVCFHYTDAEGPAGAPAETWWWFFEGRAVYSADEFLPPSGSNHTKDAFQGAKDWMKRQFGAPVEEHRDHSPSRHRFVYTGGSLSAALTLIDPDGNPYFCIEFYDPTVIDKLGPELRPDRSLPKRYTPPPRDSGLTREDLASEVGSG